jgi:hypothetical protein
LLFTPVTHAKIYTWIDENGKKHFGGVIPPQYKGQVDNVEVKIHTPTEEEVQRAKKKAAKNISKVKADREKKRMSRRSYSPSNTPAKKKKSSSDDFESRMEEYRKSQECFRSCSRPIMVPDPNAPGGQRQRGTNNSGCGHCKDIRKPTR